MISVSEAYKRESEKLDRPKSYVVAKWGNYIKNTKSSISKVESSNLAPFSNLNKTYNEIKTTNYNYISCEPNRVVLDGSFSFLQDKTKSNATENLAYWSNELSDENGNFSNEVSLTYYFSKEIKFTELTLYFQEICEEFKVIYYLNNLGVVERNVSGNNSLTVTTKGATLLSDELYFDKIKIQFIKTKDPYRYIKFNEIDFGIYQIFRDNQILSYDITEEMSLDGSRVNSNSFRLILNNSNGDYDILNPNNKLSSIAEKQTIGLYYYLKIGNKFDEIPLGQYLIKNFYTRNKEFYIDAYDDIYFLNGNYRGSHFYKNAEIKEILTDVFNYYNYTNYILDSSLDGIKLSGFVYPQELRECIRVICEAGCCVFKKERTGETKIFKIQDKNSIKTFNRNLIFKPNISENSFNKNLSISSYRYIENTSEEKVYSEELTVGKYTLDYVRYPIIEGTLRKKDETITSYTITKEYATSCEVNVTEDCTVELYAKIYDVEETINNLKKLNSDNNTTTISKNYLITDDNLNTVIEWKINRKTIKYDFETPYVPYVELGDKTSYYNKYTSKNNPFIVTRIEFSKSILQNVQGE